MKNKPQKAIVATIYIGNKEVEVLQLPDGSFAIAIAQIWRLFEFSVQPTDASRTIKRLLGKGFQYSRVYSELNPKKVNTVDLKTFELIIALLDRKGNKKAQDFRDDLVGLSLYQLSCDAFNIKFEKEERQNWLKSRQQGKLTRRTLTDAIQDYINANADQLSDKYERFVYNNCSNAVNKIVFGRNAKKLRESWKCTELRDAMTFEELSHIDSVERLAVRLIDELGYEPLSAVNEAGNRLLIKPIER